MRKWRTEASLLSVAILIFTVVAACRSQVASDLRPDHGNDAIGAVSAIREMTTQRATHTATLLGTGKVLIAGGFSSDGGSLSGAELFDPATKTFSAAGNMSVARSGHTATLLPNGKVLIAGGYNGNYLNTAEIYDAQTGRFTPAGRLVTPRSGHVAVLLKDGSVLLAGGVGTGWTFLSDAEIYNPESNTFAATGGMMTERESHTATLLNDGKVLITGGHKGRRSEITIYASAEIYDPESRRFTATGSLIVKRHKHDAVLLKDGRVLIIGGSDERDGDGAYRNAEVFDPKEGGFAAVKNNMNAARYKLQGTAIVLNNGKVLIAGGANRVEIFDPATNSFSLPDGDMGTRRLFATATLLPDGKVLITGGYSNGNSVSSGAWIYQA